MNAALFTEWTDALRCGDFERAWALSDRSLNESGSGECKHSGERHRQRIWRGEELNDRRVLVRCYHGLGDTIQFIRFAKPLREIARQVTVWAQPELLPLLRRVEGIDCLLPLHDGTPDAEYDVDIEVMELGHALRATAQSIRNRVPYLPHDTRRERPGAGVCIGLVWAAGSAADGRSAPHHLLGRLRERSAVRLFSLQQGPARAMATAIPAEDFAVADIKTLAERLAMLDLIITVDTMMAHLAGALGVPVWTMLRKNCDWRWPLTGRTTVWYPTMRLFHQQVDGDWGAVIDELIQELTVFVFNRDAGSVARHSLDRCSPASSRSHG